MNLKQKLLVSVILISTLIGLACGGGSGTSEIASSGGIGGSGVQTTSVGRVTAIGSITVNEVKFETDGAEVIINGDVTMDDSLLRVGMVVDVRGKINPDGVTGVADSVTVKTAVSGRIEAIGADTITVLGQQVMVTAQTIFDPDTVFPPSLSGLAVGDDIIVSGLIAGSGNPIEASLIEKFSTTLTQKVIGLVDDVLYDTILIDNLIVDIENADLVVFDDRTVIIGDYVEVKGSLAPVDNVFLADTVTLKASMFEDGESLDVEGTIINAADPSFTLLTAVGVIELVINDLTEFDDGLSPTGLVVGARIVVEGSVRNGILQAEEIEPTDDDDD